MTDSGEHFAYAEMRASVERGDSLLALLGTAPRGVEFFAGEQQNVMAMANVHESGTMRALLQYSLARCVGCRRRRALFSSSGVVVCIPMRRLTKP